MPTNALRVSEPAPEPTSEPEVDLVLVERSGSHAAAWVAVIMTVVFGAILMCAIANYPTP